MGLLTCGVAFGLGAGKGARVGTVAVAPPPRRLRPASSHLAAGHLIASHLVPSGLAAILLGGNHPGAGERVRAATNAVAPATIQFRRKAGGVLLRVAVGRSSSSAHRNRRSMRPPLCGRGQPRPGCPGARFLPRGHVPVTARPIPLHWLHRPPPSPSPPPAPPLPTLLPHPPAPRRAPRVRLAATLSLGAGLEPACHPVRLRLPCPQGTSDGSLHTRHLHRCSVHTPSARSSSGHRRSIHGRSVHRHNLHSRRGLLRVVHSRWRLLRVVHSRCPLRTVHSRWRLLWCGPRSAPSATRRSNRRRPRLTPLSACTPACRSTGGCGGGGVRGGAPPPRHGCAGCGGGSPRRGSYGCGRRRRRRGEG